MNALSQGLGKLPDPAAEAGLSSEKVLPDELVRKKGTPPIVLCSPLVGH